MYVPLLIYLADTPEDIFDNFCNLLLIQTALASQVIIQPYLISFLYYVGILILIKYLLDIAYVLPVINIEQHLLVVWKVFFQVVFLYLGMVYYLGVEELICGFVSGLKYFEKERGEYRVTE